MDHIICKYFSQSIDCLLVLLMISFSMQKHFSLIKSHLFIFAFMSFAMGDWPKKIVLPPMSKNVSPMFFSVSVMEVGLIFSSLNHFEIIFLYGMRESSSFIILHVAVQFSQHHLLKRLSFLHYKSLPSLSKCVGLFLGSLFCYIDLFVTLFDYYSFVV